MSKEKDIVKRKFPVKSSLICLLIILCVILFANITHTQIVSITKVDKQNYFVNKTETIKEGKVTITYKDTTGVTLKDSKVLTGKVGDVYTTERAEIMGYKSYGDDPVNKIGNFDDVDVTVNYLYEPTQDTVNTTTDGKNVNVEVIKDKDEEKQEIKISIINEDEEENIITGSKFIVSKSNGIVVRNATSYADKLIVGSITLAQVGTDKFDIKQLDVPTGYKKIEDSIRLEIEKIKTKSGKFDVTAKILNNENAVVIVKDNEIIITIKNEKEEIEESVQKIFDLQINKYITNVKVNMDGKISEKQKDRNNNELLKIDIPKNKINKTILEITYEIEVKNVGEIAGYAKEIIDNLPEDMELKESEEWVIQNRQAVSNVFENTLLQPGESQSANIVLSYKVSEDNIGIKTNGAVISVYYNEEGIEDNTPDNTSEESMLVTIRTGGKALIIIEIVAIIFVVCILIILKKRKND